MASAMREWPLPNASNRVALRCDDSTRQRTLRAPLRGFPDDPGHMRMRCSSRRRDGPMPSHRCGKRMRFNGNMQSVSLVHVPHRYGVFGHAYGRGRSRQIPPGNRTPRWSRVPVLSHMSGVARTAYRFNARLCECYASDEGRDTDRQREHDRERHSLQYASARHFARTTGPPRPKLEQQHRTSMSGTGPQARCHAEHEVDQNPHEADSREDQESDVHICNAKLSVKSRSSTDARFAVASVHCSATCRT